jgi:hypothetical protein
MKTATAGSPSFCYKSLTSCSRYFLLQSSNKKNYAPQRVLRARPRHQNVETRGTAHTLKRQPGSASQGWKQLTGRRPSAEVTSLFWLFRVWIVAMQASPAVLLKINPQ